MEKMIPWKKPRSKLGSWMDQNKVSQEWLRKETGLNKSTISELCSEDCSPHNETRRNIIKALRKIDPLVSASEFW